MSGHSKGSKQALNAAQRHAEALELRLSGMTYRQIGESMGFTESRAWKIIMDELARLNKERSELAEDVVRLEVDRLDRFLLGVFPAAESGDEKAIDAAMKIMARRAKLCGLDAPTKIESTGDVTLSVILPANETWSADADADSNEGGT